MADVEIKYMKKIKIKKNPIIIEGLPGLGLVGTIAASYLVEKLDMEPFAYITCDEFPPLVAIHNYKPLYPVRLYYSTKYNLIVFLSEFIIPLDVVDEMARQILGFGKKAKASTIVSLGSINIKGEQDTVYAITSNIKESKKLAKIKNVQLIKEGATTGVTALLLAQSAVEKFPVISLLAEAHPDYVDPRAASMVLSVLNDLIPQLKIDTKSLDKEAKALESKMKNMISKAKDAQVRYKRLEQTDSLGTMYG